MANAEQRLSALESAITSIAQTQAQLFELLQGNAAQIVHATPAPTPTRNEPGEIPADDARKAVADDVTKAARERRNWLRGERRKEYGVNGKSQRYVDLTVEYRDLLALGEEQGYWKLSEASLANIARWANMQSGTMPQPVGNAKTTRSNTRNSTADAAIAAASRSGTVPATPTRDGFVSANGKKTFTTEAARNAYDEQCRVQGARLAAGRAAKHAPSSPNTPVKPASTTDKAVLHYGDTPILRSTDGDLVVMLDGVRCTFKHLDRAMAAIDAATAKNGAAEDAKRDMAAIGF
jgi:hypothetical protein